MPPSFVDRPIWPQCNLSKALDLVLAQLRADPILSAGVRRWQVWDGGKDDVTPIGWTDLPAVRITGSLGASQWSDEASHRFPLTLRFELFQKGTRQQHLFDFWHAVFHSLFPIDGSTVFLEKLYAVGTFQRTIVGPSPEPRDFDGGGLGLYGQGQIVLQIRIDT